MHEGWIQTTVGSVLDPKRPITYGVVQPGEHDPDGIPLVRGGDFSFGWRPIEEYRRVSRDIERRFARARLKAGDVVITIKGDVGTAAIVPDFLNGANLSQTNARLAIDHRKAQPELVLAFLRSREGQKQIAAVTQSGAQPGLIFRDILALQMSLPPLAEQRRIARVLAEWDVAIEKIEALLRLKKERTRALTTRLLFSGGRRTKFFSYPDDTELRPVGSFARLKPKDKNSRATLPPVFSCTKHAGLVLSDEYFGRRVYSDDLSGYLFVDEGDFCYATNHLEEGSIGLMSARGGGLVSPMYTVFRVSDSTVDPQFLITLFKTETMRRMFERNTSASVDRRGGLRWEEFSKIEVPVPSLLRQRAIYAFLSASQLEIGLLAIQAKTLRRQKRGLMQKLLTGHWRTGDTPEREAAE